MSGGRLALGCLLAAAAGGTLWLGRGRRPPSAVPAHPLGPVSASVAHRRPAAAGLRASAAGTGEPGASAAEDVNAAIEDWSDLDPASLAAYAWDMPRGPLRSLALASALPKWVHRDAVAASEWLANCPTDPDLDPGAVALAMLPELPERRPQVSIDWAVGITDAGARDAALQNIAERWAKQAPEAVSAYVSGAPDLRPSDRESLAVGVRIAAAPPGQRGL